MNWYKNLRMKAKLILGFGLVSILSLVVILITERDIYTLNEADTTLYREGVLAVSYAADITTEFARTRASVRSAILETDPEKVRGHQRDIETYEVAMRKSLAELMEIVKNLPNRAKMAQDLQESMEAYIKASGPVVDLAVAGRNAEAWSLMNTPATTETVAQFREELDQLNYFTKIAEDRSNDNTALIKRLITVGVTSTIILFILSIIIGIWTANHLIVTNKIEQIPDAATPQKYSPPFEKGTILKEEQKEVQIVKISDLDIPFGTMVKLCFKWTMASIIVAIPIALAVWAIFGIIETNTPKPSTSPYNRYY